MIRYKKEIKEVTVFEGIVCNICEQSIQPIQEGASEEYVSLDAFWGYGAQQHLDGEGHEAHVCEPCYTTHIEPLFKISPIIKRSAFDEREQNNS